MRGGGGVREGERRSKSIGGASFLVEEPRLEAVPGLERLTLESSLFVSMDLAMGVTGRARSLLENNGVMSAADNGGKSDSELLRFFFGDTAFRPVRSSPAEA
jgi:hypothetical protein